MSGSQEEVWSDNPNAPKIPYYLYIAEKSRLAGVSLGPILYGTWKISRLHAWIFVLKFSVVVGILVVLFFQCMVALFNSANRRREGINWWLVSYTVLMFSLATILLGTGMTVQFDCYIDNREYPGAEGGGDLGPLGYRDSIGPGALLMTDGLVSSLSYWLADGFLVGCLFV